MSAKRQPYGIEALFDEEPPNRSPEELARIAECYEEIDITDVRLAPNQVLFELLRFIRDESRRMMGLRRLP